MNYILPTTTPHLSVVHGGATLLPSIRIERIPSSCLSLLKHKGKRIVRNEWVELDSSYRTSSDNLIFYYILLSSARIELATAINQFFYREPPLPIGSPAPKKIIRSYDVMKHASYN